MTQHTEHREPLTDQKLDEIAGRAAGLYEYATGLDTAWQAEADQLAGEDVPALVDEIRRLQAELADQRAYEQRLREQHDLDVAELNRLRARVWELERPAVEKQRNEIRDSFAELIATCRETKDFEGAFDVECRLREREEQWKAEDAANQPAAEETHVVADDSDDPEHIDDCPGCEAFTLTGHRAPAAAVVVAGDSGTGQ